MLRALPIHIPVLLLLETEFIEASLPEMTKNILGTFCQKVYLIYLAKGCLDVRELHAHGDKLREDDATSWRRQQPATAAHSSVWPLTLAC